MTDNLSPQNAALLDLPPVMATFLKANSADAYAEADRHPIAIVKNGRRTHVLMSAEAYSALARTEPPNPAPSAEGVEAVARIIEDMVSGPILRDPLLREAHRQDVLKAAAAILALPAQSVSQTDTLAERVAVPAGWRLVPEEISDGDSVGEIFAILEDFGCEDLSVAEAYAKIVETMARPTPPPSPGPETGVEISEVDRIWDALKTRCCAHKPDHPEFDNVKRVVMVSKDDLTAALHPQTSSKGEV